MTSEVVPKAHFSDGGKLSPKSQPNFNDVQFISIISCANITLEFNQSLPSVY